MGVAKTQPEAVAGYRVLDELGRGGMGVVYRAVSDAGRPVAVKVIGGHRADDRASRTRFLREIEVARRVKSPHVVEVIEGGRLDTGELYLAMELVGGVGLDELVKRRGALDVRRALEIGVQVGRALAAVHGAGIIHRDVKGPNVLVREEGDTVTAKLVDFGVALDLDAALTRVTATGQMVGTPIAVAPEQLEGKAVGPPADIYSVGVLLYQLLTGAPPFVAADFRTLAYQHVFVEPDPPSARRPGIAVEVDRVVQQCLAKDPAHRFQTATALVSSLDHLLQHGPLELPGGAGPVKPHQAHDDAPTVSVRRVPRGEKTLVDVDAQALPLLHGYLARLPDGLDSFSACHLKAGVLKLVVGQLPADEVASALPPFLAELVRDPPPVSTWIREVHYTAVLHAATDVLLEGRAQRFEERRHKAFYVGAMSAPFYRALFDGQSPRRLLSALERTWRFFAQGTTAELLRHDERRARLRLVAPPGLRNGYSVYGFGHAISAALECGTASNVQPHVETDDDELMRTGVAEVTLSWDEPAAR